MKKLIAIATLMLLAGVVIAQQRGRPAQGADMPHAQQMEQMQERMQAMQQLMERIRNTEDADERQRLMQQHMETMHESMMSMHEMMGGAMTGSRRGGERPAQARECPQGDTQCELMQMREQQEMMSQRMSMMQQMMQQMMQHMSQHQGMEMNMPDREDSGD